MRLGEMPNLYFKKSAIKYQFYTEVHIREMTYIY